jgi:HNH endonuclease
MAFSEKTKTEVKRKAAFHCCRCREIGIDVHHIIPKAHGGPDKIDNAAPLCQNCHDRYGANPEKRKEIRQMRDWWYEVVKEKFFGKTAEVEKIDEILVELKETREDNREAINSLKADLLAQLAALANQQSIADAPTADVPRKVDDFISATRLARNVYANFVCKHCGTRVGLLVGADRCPGCKRPIS